jgi:hypothetical protein
MILVMFRPLSGGRWRQIGTAETLRAALDLMTLGSGDYWIHEPKAEAGLFAGSDTAVSQADAEADALAGARV